ncbi:MAG: YihY/virulence factor BrkB family protein [Paracoccaceae bacterium]
MADTTADRGRDAERLREIPKRGWRDIVMRTKDEIGRDHVSIVAAGVAFFGLLALFPLIGSIVSIAGLVFEPQTITGQIDSFASQLPEGAANILKGQAQAVAGSGGLASLTAIVGILLTLYSASSGTKNLMEGMNIAYDEEEGRGFLMKNVVGLSLTLMLIVLFIVGVAIIVVAPAVIGSIGLGSTLGGLSAYLRWPVLALVAIFALAVLYRYGPNRANPEWRWVTPGAVVATILWLVGSAAFSFYVSNFGSYNETYGALAGVIILLLWLWLSSFCILLGAELNSEIEHQTGRDSTTGEPKPQGERGAVKADHVGMTPS